MVLTVLRNLFNQQHVQMDTMEVVIQITLTKTQVA